jgi:hypothetical protein
MDGEELRYSEIVEEALRGVVRAALVHVARHGLPGNHHFYINFQTEDPGVVMSDRLRSRHPREMTVVMENRFWDLEVSQESFGVTLSFQGTKERLVIPYSAITEFLDPSVQFGLRFAPEGEDGDDNIMLPTVQNLEDGPATLQQEDKEASPGEAPQDADEGASEKTESKGKGGEVIALDAFRKK